MRQQYGLRIQSGEFAEMAWGEFADLLSGLNETTPLVRVAQIRTESDPERLKAFTPEQRAMRAEWQRRKALSRPQAETDAFLSQVQGTLREMFGKEG